jgi:hypothetical protein
MNAEPIAALSETEKNDVIRLLGYPISSPAASIGLGIPNATQTAFLVQMSLQLLPQSMVGRVREMIVILDATDQRIFAAQKRLAAKKVGEIDLNPDEPDLLEREYRRWAFRLSEMLGAPINQYADRFAGMSINVPFNNGL